MGGYFYVRLYWSGFFLPANIVEEYILLSIILHAIAGLKRTWNNNIKKGICSGSLNLAMTGVLLLMFMSIHIVQFRFGDAQDYLCRAPPYLINFMGIPSLQLFWTADKSVTPVVVRDIYKLEFDRFQMSAFGIPNFWSYYYLFSVVIYLMHACWGWEKCLTVLGGSFVLKQKAKTPYEEDVWVQRPGIPKMHQWRVNWYGRFIFVFLAAIYISYPLFCMYGTTDGQLECGDVAGNYVNSTKGDWKLNYLHCKK